MIEPEKVRVFENIEELKWHYHSQMVKKWNTSYNSYMMERIAECKTVEEANELLKSSGTPYRIKET